MRQSVGVAAGQRGSVLAARSGNRIRYELGASGGQCSGIKDGVGTGGNVPSWLPDALSFGAGFGHPATPWPRPRPVISAG